MSSGFRVKGRIESFKVQDIGFQIRTGCLDKRGDGELLLQLDTCKRFAGDVLVDPIPL